MALIEIYTDAGLYDESWRITNKIYGDWCKENCKEWWGSDLLSQQTRWSFKCKLDAAGFKLRWL